MKKKTKKWTSKILVINFNGFYALVMTKDGSVNLSLNVRIKDTL